MGIAVSVVTPNKRARVDSSTRKLSSQVYLTRQFAISNRSKAALVVLRAAMRPAIVTGTSSPEFQEWVGDSQWTFLDGGVTMNTDTVSSAVRFPITDADTGKEEFTIDGNVGQALTAGDPFDVAGSSGNDGNYTVSAATFDSSTDETVITVSGTVPDGTADGFVELPALVFKSSGTLTQPSTVEIDLGVGDPGTHAPETDEIDQRVEVNWLTGRITFPTKDEL